MSTSSSKVCMWDAFGDFACSKAPSAPSLRGKDAVPGFSPAGAFGSEGAAVSFDSQTTSCSASGFSQQREGFTCNCGAGAH
jgi:hypothetical protein